MRGLNVPFYKNMTFKKSKYCLTEGLLEKPSILIDLIITDAFKVIVTLDGDNGVHCKTVSM
jgi:ribosome maturation factor RimP